VRALAVGNDKRATILPNLPTVSEAGVPGFYNAPWNALYAPAKTSPAIVKRLNSEVGRALSDETFAQYLITNGAEPRASSPAELVEFMRRENAQLRKVITAANITAE
jgi:tripartite-type tricarboxylate transporter receptor subunit TctC